LLLQDRDFILGITELLVELPVLLDNVLLLSEDTLDPVLMVSSLSLELFVKLRVPLVQVLFLRVLSEVLGLEVN
jgi:hypothetical protein